MIRNTRSTCAGGGALTSLRKGRRYVAAFLRRVEMPAITDNHPRPHGGWLLWTLPRWRRYGAGSDGWNGDGSPPARLARVVALPSHPHERGGGPR